MIDETSVSIITVLFHSGYGHTDLQAKAVARGAASVQDAEVEMLSVLNLGEDLEGPAWIRLDLSDAIVFGCPTYMGGPSAPMKSFMDASSKRWFDLRWKDKITAGFTTSGSHSGDKLNTLISLAIFAAQHGMLWVSLGLKAGNNTAAGNVNDLNRLGSFLGAMAQANIDCGAEEGMLKSDLLTAEHLGRRTAEWTHRLRSAP